jgi:phage-related protein
MHGFHKVQTTDHQLAAFLRRHGAIDNWHGVSRSNTWHAPDGRAVAVCIYDNAASTYDCWIADGLAFP